LREVVGWLGCDVLEASGSRRLLGLRSGSMLGCRTGESCSRRLGACLGAGCGVVALSVRQSSAHPRAASNAANRAGARAGVPIIVRIDTGISLVGQVGIVRSTVGRGRRAANVA
jgi:hypothetical protein